MKTFISEQVKCHSSYGNSDVILSNSASIPHKIAISNLNKCSSKAKSAAGG